MPADLRNCTTCAHRAAYAGGSPHCAAPIGADGQDATDEWLAHHDVHGRGAMPGADADGCPGWEVRDAT